MTTTVASSHRPLPGPSFRPLTTLRILKDPEMWLQKWALEYGDPYMVHTMNGRVLITGDPDEVKKIFAAPPDTFEVFAPHAIRALLGETSVIGSDEPRHMRDRKLLMPPFHGDRMRAYAEGMVDATRNAIAPFRDGKSFSFLEVTQRLSLEVILRSVFGLDVAAERERHSEAIRKGIEAINPAFIFVKTFQVSPLGLGPFANFKRKQAEADLLLQEQIDRLRGNTEGRVDILSMLLDAEYDDGSGGMSDDEIKDQLRTLLTAGHETTAFALTWALYCFFQNPDAAKTLMAELDAHRGAPALEIARLPYLEAYLKETLRLYPPLTEILRLLRKPFDVAGHHLEAGTGVAPCVTLIHRNPTLYPEPEKFRPERFLERTYGPHEYLPFGGGHRRCIGSAFANLEMACALYTFLSETTFTRTDTLELKMHRAHLTMCPNHPLNVTAKERRENGE